MALEISEKVSHCIIFSCCWTAWVFSVISLASYNWISENIGSINGPYTYGLFMERATCALCQPIPNPPPFLYATRCFMVLGCLLGIVVCILDVYTVLRNHSKTMKRISVIVLIITNVSTLIAVSVFQGNGILLIEENEIEGTLLQPYGYGLVLAWCCWVLYTLAVPFVVYEARFRQCDSGPDIAAGVHARYAPKRDENQTSTSSFSERNDSKEAKIPEENRPPYSPPHKEREKPKSPKKRNLRSEFHHGTFSSSPMQSPKFRRVHPATKNPHPQPLHVNVKHNLGSDFNHDSPQNSPLQSPQNRRRNHQHHGASTPQQHCAGIRL